MPLTLLAQLEEAISDEPELLLAGGTAFGAARDFMNRLLFSSPATYCQAVAAYERDLLDRNLGESSLARVRLVMARYHEFLVATGVIAADADPPLTAILTLELARAFAPWLAHYATRNDLTGHIATLGPSSVRSYVSCLRTFARWCFDEGHLGTAFPLERFKPPKVPRTTVVREYRPDEIERLGAAIDRLPHLLRNRAIFYFLLDTGVRNTELCTLRRDQIDLRRMAAKVLGKGGKTRTVFFEARTARALDAYDQALGQRREPVFFLTRYGDPFERRSLHSLIKGWAEAATPPVAGATVHRLRHTMACNFLRANPDQLHTLMIRLGHETIDMTLRYARHLDAERAGTSALTPLFGADAALRPARRVGPVQIPAAEPMPLNRRRRPPPAPEPDDDDDEIAALQAELDRIGKRLLALRRNGRH